MSDGADKPVMVLNGLRFGYAPDRDVIADVSAELRAARVTALVGPNAAGKTTLLRLMLGQLDPASGSVSIDGQDVRSLRAATRAAWVSYVPQRSGAALGFNVEQVVAMGRFAMRGMIRLGMDAASRSAVDAAIDACALNDLRGEPFTALSVGQQQRVMLARAVAQSAGRGRVMLLDEPGSAMDLRHLHATMRMLRDMTQRGLAVLIVVHDLNLAARYADDVWLLDGGRLIAAGPWRDVLREDLLEQTFGVSIRRLEGGERTDDGNGGSDRPVFDMAASDTLT